MEGYHDLFGDVYRYFSKYRDTFTLEEWEAAAHEICTVSYKWEQTPLKELAIDLFVAVYAEMERRYKKRKEAEAPQQE